MARNQGTHTRSACQITPTGKMKRIFRKIREKIRNREDLPPPYREEDFPRNSLQLQRQSSRNHNDQLNDVSSFQDLDLVANCRTYHQESDSEVSYAEINENMGLWHSTPINQRHKSKISLTWVLKENLESTKTKEQRIEKLKPMDRYQRHNQKFNEKSDRVVGRNEFYHSLKFKSACDLVNRVDTWSDTTSADTVEYRRKRHRHRRKKRAKPNGKFGYDITDLDSFLSEASLDRPGNIPVVVAYPTTLYQTQNNVQKELCLPLGTVVNAVFKTLQWLYVQTPHGNEGYVMYNACLPLGILPNRNTAQKKTPCWESSTDIYPRPCGNLTDNEKEKLRKRTRSETRYATSRDKRQVRNSQAEKDFDSLYLKTKSFSSNIDKIDYYEEWRPQTVQRVHKQRLLVILNDYKGTSLNRTITVQQGEVVVLVPRKGDSDEDKDWFYVRKRDGTQGYIPAVVAGNGYI